MNKLFFKTTMFLVLTCILFLCPLKVQAAEQEAIGPVDIDSITKYTERDGWSWDPETKTLTLAGVNMNGYLSYSYTENPNKVGKNSGYLFDLPYGSTIIVKEGTVNNLAAKYSGDCFYVYEYGVADTSNGVTIKGGGTLNMSRGEICIFVNSNLTIEDVTLNFDDADIPIMTDVNYTYDENNNVSYKQSTLTFDNVILNVTDCTGGIYTYGDYDINGLETNVAPATAPVIIKNSTFNMDVKLDQGNERNHHCFLIRNGDLTIEDSTLNLSSYHPTAVVWKQYPAGTAAESLINIKESTIEGDVEIAKASTTIANSVVHAETFVAKGGTTSIAFEDNSMSFGHVMTNASKEVSIKAIPKYTITFDAQGGTTCKSVIVHEGKQIGALPISTKSGYTFVGWSTVKDATTANVTSATVVTKDMTLYAVWKINEPANSEAKTEKVITELNTDKNDPADSTVSKLMLKATGKKKAVKLTWKKVSGATSYVIYGNTCGKQMKKLKTVSAKKKTHTFKKLKAGKYYKYIVVAYKEVNGFNTAIATSKSVHCVTNGGKNGNPTAIKGVKSTIKVKVNKTQKLKPTLKVNKKVKTHIAKFRYESSNPSVATVTKKGVVKGISKGNATIYIYAQNGVCKKVKVNVTQ